jgi:hypothetical protein
MGTDHQKEQSDDYTWYFERGERLEIELSHVTNDLGMFACLSSKTLIKSLDTEAQWSFLVGEHPDVQGGWHSLTPWGEGTEALSPGPCLPCFMQQFHLAVPDLYPL